LLKSLSSWFRFASTKQQNEDETQASSEESFKDVEMESPQVDVDQASRHSTPPSPSQSLPPKRGNPTLNIPSPQDSSNSSSSLEESLVRASPEPSVPKKRPSLNFSQYKNSSNSTENNKLGTTKDSGLVSGNVKDGGWMNLPNTPKGNAREVFGRVETPREDIRKKKSEFSTLNLGGEQTQSNLQTRRETANFISVPKTDTVTSLSTQDNNPNLRLSQYFQLKYLQGDNTAPSRSELEELLFASTMATIGARESSF
jgi:hypothetical protein